MHFYRFENRDFLAGSGINREEGGGFSPLLITFAQRGPSGRGLFASSSRGERAEFLLEGGLVSLVEGS